MSELVFIKLGGSLISDKNTPHTARMDIIERIAFEISNALRECPSISLLIGHGSGSFGHIPAKKYATIDGVKSSEYWHGFAEVWHEARTLNNIVTDQLAKTGIPIISFPPSSQVVTSNRKIVSWDTTQIKSALQNGLVPLIYGDVIYDQIIGGTILSTEELFKHLAKILLPSRILLAGIEEGVWYDPKDPGRIMPIITCSNLNEVASVLGKSASPDVTGGMQSKVSDMMELIEQIPDLMVSIFSGKTSGNIFNALIKNAPGTQLCAGRKADFS